MTLSKFPSLVYPLPKANRHLAYSEAGDPNSAHVLLCLPGLLETRATFDPERFLMDKPMAQSLGAEPSDAAGLTDEMALV
jgi:hypothetical protein